eukprot:m.66836 g.66836  ORF g.66836 m.66836 type:complete len:883 (-) comp11842_c0_seq1:6-2654(-)
MGHPIPPFTIDMANARENHSDLVASYIAQLSVGCLKSKCSNPFCATGQKRNLKGPTAKLVGLQLASSYGSGRLCLPLHDWRARLKLNTQSDDSLSHSSNRFTALLNKLLNSCWNAPPTNAIASCQSPSREDQINFSALTFVKKHLQNGNLGRTDPGEPVDTNVAAQVLPVSYIEALVQPWRENGPKRNPKMEASLPWLEDNELLSAIRYHFSNPKSLVGSFSSKIDSPDEHLGMFFKKAEPLVELVSNVGSVIKILQAVYLHVPVCQFDFATLHSILKTLLSVNSMVQTRAALIASLHNSTVSLSTKSNSKGEEPNEIYIAATVLKIVLEFPELGDRESRGLLVSVCQSIASASIAVKLLLATWLAKLSLQKFSSVVKMVQDFLSSEVGSEHMCANTHAAIRTLQLLNDANDLRKEILNSCNTTDLDQNALRLESFYNEDLAARINFKDEYNYWKKRQQDPLLSPPSPLEYPFLFDPACKARVLRIDAVVQMSAKFQDAFMHQAWVLQTQKMMMECIQHDAVEPVVREAIIPYLVLGVRREHLVEDTMTQVSQKLKDLKKPLKVKYVGGGEHGLDMGGVQKEFFQLIMEAILDPQKTMFHKIEDTRAMWINGSSLEAFQEFELVGILVGLAIYNSVILNLQFPLALYKKLLGESLQLQDLKETFPELGRGMQQLLEFDGDVANVFCQSFHISESCYGEMLEIDLIEGGGNIPVTNDNRKEFVDLYVDYKLNSSIEEQFKAFSRGFHLVCGGPALTLFRPEELEMLLCGCVDMDLSLLESSTTYTNGYHRDSAVIDWLWEILFECSADDLRSFLYFVTGSDRVPIKGLAQLSITVQRNGPDSMRLPTAMTCFSRLLLPEYGSKDKLKDRLTLAMSHGKGFGLV